MLLCFYLFSEKDYQKIELQMATIVSSTSSLEAEFIESENNLRSFGDNKYSRKATCIRKMYLFAFSALLISMTMGLSAGYSAPATYDMKTRENSAVKPSEKDVSWIGSILALGTIVGSIIAGPLADKIGRKDILMYNIIPSGFGWLIICYAESVPVLIFGRFVNGVSCGITAVVVPTYCVEISTPEVRGKLGSAVQGFVVIGKLLSVTIGAIISWKYLALHGAVFSIFVITCFSLAPETPRWFLMKHDLKSAISTMHKIQGGFLDAEEECETIYKDLQNKPKGSITLAEFTHPTVIKPGLINLAVSFFKEFSGVNAVLMYSSNIFEISKDFMDPKIGTIIIGAVQVFATITSNLIIDKVGRKKLLITSGSLMSISCAILGIYYYKISVNNNYGKMHSWILLACLVLCIIGYSLGYGPIPSLLSAEMLPVRARSTVCAILEVVKGLFVFIITNTFSDMENHLYSYGTFWFFSTVSVIGVIFVTLFVPETKGKKLEAIQDFFVKKQIRRVISIGVLN